VLILRSCIISHRQCQTPPSWNVTVYDIPSHFPRNFDCVPLPSEPSPSICVHDITEDVHISLSIKQGKLWEQDIMAVYRELLSRDRQLGVIDIGANIGQYSLFAAAMGHSVVSVEARKLHIEMLAEASQISHLENKLLLVHNAVSDRRTTVTLQLSRDNQGATKVIEANLSQFCRYKYCKTPHNTIQSIIMDDLIPVIAFSRAILKIDIEGFELKAISGTRRLFEKLFIPYVLMEWVYQKIRIKHTRSREDGDKLISLMTDMGYGPFSIQKRALVTKDWPKWPNDILWKHKLAVL
jgi:FkbM family methyltransferase